MDVTATEAGVGFDILCVRAPTVEVLILLQYLTSVIVLVLLCVVSVRYDGNIIMSGTVSIQPVFNTDNPLNGLNN